MMLHEAEALAWRHMIAHGLPQKRWKFDFHYRHSALGTCSYRDRTICLSVLWTLENNEAEVLDTILHEIAHALTPHDGHGKRWKQACLKVGCRPIRCADMDKNITPQGKYVATCKNGHVSYKQNKQTNLLSCGKCSKSYNPEFALTFQPNTNYKPIR